MFWQICTDEDLCNRWGGPKDSENTPNWFLSKNKEKVFWQIGTDMTILAKFKWKFPEKKVLYLYIKGIVGKLHSAPKLQINEEFHFNLHFFISFLDWHCWKEIASYGFWLLYYYISHSAVFKFGGLLRLLDINLTKQDKPIS